MNDVIIVEILDSFHDLFQEIDSFLFWQLSLLFEIVIQIVIAYFSDDVHVIIRLEDIIKVNDILVIHFFHDFYLRMQIFYVKITCEDSLVYHLHCNCFSGFDDFAFVN